MQDNFPYFKSLSKITKNAWKNSVRHTLSLHKGFQKIARPEPDSDGIKQGCFWTLNPEKIDREYEELHRDAYKGIQI